MATATAVKAAITPNLIATARVRAVDACNAAYAPQVFPNVAVPLCWAGRIARAYERLAQERIKAHAAKTQGKAPAVKAIEDAIATMEKQANAAYSDAERAASDWAAMCAAAGIECNPLDVYPVQCSCDGCTQSHKAGARIDAHGKLAMAVYGLLAPSDVDLPPFVALLRRAGDEEAGNDLWRYWKAILDAAEAYIAACDADGVKPNWRGVLYPVEG